jgi:adenosylcobinamide kinase/adenosylcobinamide-phosphate guanylyltransferase
MKSNIILVTGGARSGKSAFAEACANTYAGRHSYIATAQILDEEMAARIAIHRQRRPSFWHTYEVPAGLPQTIESILDASDIILMDCLTLYFSNYLLAHETESDNAVITGALDEMNNIMTHIMARSDKTAIFVTNELGCGIVPLGRINRTYRDMMGRINQFVAAKADKVFLTVSGITMEIKSRQVQLPESGGTT